MKKIVLYTLLFVTLIGNMFGQALNFYSQAQIATQSELGAEGVPGFPNKVYFNPTSWGELVPGIEYSYLWSFGDGAYSREIDPTHTYPERMDAKKYEVVLYATPVYTPLGPPPAVYLPNPEKINIDPSTTNSSYTYMTHKMISLSYNRLPRATYESTFILTYRNISGSTAPFPVHFEFNEDYFKYEGFVAPGSETIVNSSNIPGNGQYSKQLTFQSTDPLGENEERTIFIQLKAKAAVLGGMEIEPDGKVEIEGVPELYVRAETDFAGTMAPLDDELIISAVGSWDPNNKISSIDYIDRDEITFPEKIRYRINCENVGNGPTGSVTITDHVSSFLDLSSGVIVDQKDPGKVFTPTLLAEGISFSCTNLILEGTSSADVPSLDECQYWIEVEYDINSTVFNSHFSPSFDCSASDLLGSFGTNAEIIFDGHLPIPTNIASTEVFCEVIMQPFEITNVFPNPADEIVDVTYVISPSTETIDLNTAHAYLIDVNTGASQEIFGLTFDDDSEGTHQVQVDISFANPGMYILSIQVSGHTFVSSTIVKQ